MKKSTEIELKISDLKVELNKALLEESKEELYIDGKIIVTENIGFLISLN